MRARSSAAKPSWARKQGGWKSSALAPTDDAARRRFAASRRPCPILKRARMAREGLKPTPSLPHLYSWLRLDRPRRRPMREQKARRRDRCAHQRRRNASLHCAHRDSRPGGHHRAIGPDVPGRSFAGWGHSTSGSCVRPKGLPSESRHTAQRSPGWITSPPDSATRLSAPGRSPTAKYGSENRSPGPAPRSWSPRATSPSCACQPCPSPGSRSTTATWSTCDQNRRARSGSSAGNSMSFSIRPQ